MIQCPSLVYNGGLLSIRNRADISPDAEVAADRETLRQFCRERIVGPVRMASTWDLLPLQIKCSIVRFHGYQVLIVSRFVLDFARIATVLFSSNRDIPEKLARKTSPPEADFFLCSHKTFVRLLKGANNGFFYQESGFLVVRGLLCAVGFRGLGADRHDVVTR